MKCENCKKEITHNKGKYIVSNGITELKLNVCCVGCANILMNRLY